jgi:membrane associated rhomboid family serine protease
MGIQDRDYYRDGPSFFARWAGNGKVTLWLLGLNVVIFLMQVMTRTEHGGPLEDWFVLDVNKLFAGQVWRLLSYAFLHASFWHLAGNMLFLWLFGRQVEEEIGSGEYLLYYLLAAVLAGFAFVAIDVLFVHPLWQSKIQGGVLGASGAVMAVLVLAACRNPRQVVYLMLLVPVPIWLFVIIYVLIDVNGLLQLLRWRESGGVAVAAHLGGAAFGFLYFRNGWRLSGLLGWVRMPGRSKPRLRLYREDDTLPRPAAAPRQQAQRSPLTAVSESAAPRAAAARPDDEHLEAKVDDILAKVSRVGMQGLTEHERQTLMRASEAIKRRRG